MSTHPAFSLLKSLIEVWNYSYTEGYACDVLRKSLGYVPVLWTLIDDYWGCRAGRKHLEAGWTKLTANRARYLVLLDLLICCLADHVFTAVAIVVAVGIACVAWMQTRRSQWTAANYLAGVLFPGMGRGGAKEVRFLVLVLCDLVSALCFAVKLESRALGFLALISFYVLYSFVEEKGFAIALAVLTFNWPMLALAMTEKYPLTLSLRGSSNFVPKKQATK